MNNDVNYFLLKAGTSDFEVVENADFSWVNLGDVYFSFLVKSHNHSSGRHFHKDNSALVLSELAKNT